ncbi:(2Fe-2S)-binding protein [Corticimicrobacter populi]|uniref:Bacterioferritin-associated ferredoxin n=1 Tax=Corticimicrobacter populi TaxID=2175229 RepID=A0A2V1JY27_9BURK|nr:(2Fe-2S)-binding protein [Corticimicrobacter populi]PWF22247.1 bacterioferritin [Corticimicrobacter populi]QDQ86312.1 bacterioferritin [Alcaligenaceae bacterium SJ-26]
MYICICNAVTERQVNASVARGARTLSDLQADLGVATCCGCCAEMAESYLPCASACACAGGCCDCATAMPVAPVVESGSSRGERLQDRLGFSHVLEAVPAL